jgi:riboflavin-specific deaminase-like protein
VRRLIPDPGETTVEEQLDSYEPWLEERDGRPFVAMNFVATVDGRATIGGVSGPIGSEVDTALLVGLRTRFDAVMIGAGTMRAERYGRPVARRERRERRESLGLPGEPLTVIVSGSLELPWDAPLFTEEEGRVLVFTTEDAPEPPRTASSLQVVRHQGAVEIGEALRRLREEHGVRALLSEGGPRLHAEMQAAGLVDELFLTTAPKLSGGAAPRILEGELAEVMSLELAWLLEEEGELFARYRRAR